MRKQICLLLVCGFVFIAGCSGNRPASSSPVSSVASHSSVAQSSAVISSSSEPSDTIPGLVAADIKLNLKKWIPEAKVQNTSNGVSYQGTGTDADTGIEMAYTIQGHSPTQITGTTFTALNAKTNKGFAEFAKGFLGLCATVPYTGNNQQAARSWLEANISKVSAGKPAETAIGGVKFTLSGGPQTRTLQLSKAQ